MKKKRRIRKKKKGLAGKVVRGVVGGGGAGTIARALVGGTALGAAAAAPSALKRKLSGGAFEKAVSAYKTARHAQGGKKSIRESFGIAKKIYKRNRSRNKNFTESDILTADFKEGGKKRRKKSLVRVSLDSRNSVSRAIQNRRIKKYKKSKTGHAFRGANYAAGAVIGAGAYKGAKVLGSLSRSQAESIGIPKSSSGFGKRVLRGGWNGGMGAKHFYTALGGGAVAGLGVHAIKNRKKNKKKKRRR